MALICPTWGRNLYNLPTLGPVRAEIIFKKLSLHYFSVSDAARASQGKTGFVCANNSSQLPLLVPQSCYGVNNQQQQLNPFSVFVIQEGFLVLQGGPSSPMSAVSDLVWEHLPDK